jgi:predicted lipoprotein with Yx(FWY)xxD motif
MSTPGRTDGARASALDDEQNDVTTGGHVMKRLLISGAAVAAVLALAACGSGGGGNGGSSPGAMASSAGSTTVSSAQIGDKGNVLVDSAGKALYASDEETGGMVLCTDACLSFWTPVTVNGGKPTDGSLPGKLGIVKRPDGTRQVTYDGKLLYSFNEDQPGEVTGDGFVDAFGGQQFTWHVVQSNGSSGSSGSSGSTTTGPYGY